MTTSVVPSEGDSIARLVGARRDEGRNAIGGAGCDLRCGRQSERPRDLRIHLGKWRARRQHFREQIVAHAELVEPGRPGARDRVVAELQRVVLVADAVMAREPAGDPVRLVNGVARIADIVMAQQIEQLGQRAARAMRAALARGDRRDARRLTRGACIIVHQTRRAGAAGGVDQQQRARRAVHDDARDVAETDGVAELADGRQRGLPPQLRCLVDGVAVDARCGQRDGCEAADAGLRIDGTGAHASGSDIDAEIQTSHATSSLSGARASMLVALQHVWGIDAPFGLCNFLQDVKKFASGLFLIWHPRPTGCR
ncbi:hypothetical protein M2194_008026 [Bradyrhizobium elkanii]|nr:hypothetical protein [Bradyrhizobium elkanii]